MAASAVPSAPLWEPGLAADPAPPVNQFTAAAPDQAPLNTSSLAPFSSLPDVVLSRFRDTLSMTEAVSPYTLFQLTLPATAALKLVVEGLALGAWIDCRLVKFQVLSTLMWDLSNTLSSNANGAPTMFFMASVPWSLAAAPVLDHLFTVSKPLWFSELEAPSRATVLMVPPLLPVT